MWHCSVPWETPAKSGLLIVSQLVSLEEMSPTARHRSAQNWNEPRPIQPSNGRGRIQAATQCGAVQRTCRVLSAVRVRSENDTQRQCAA
jgi:hypothetical protein